MQSQRQYSPSLDRNTTQAGDDGLSRPRRVEPKTNAAANASPEGPIIRVALMTDVASVALSCPSGLIVNRAEKTFEEGKWIATGSLRVELRHRAERDALRDSKAAVYHVSAGTSDDARAARKLADELNKKFFEPVSTSFDEKQKDFAVLIGQFRDRSDATRMAERLRKAGYDEARVVEDRKPEKLASESVKAATSRTAKYTAQPTYAGGERAILRPEYATVEMAALAADRLAASSGDELIISPLTKSSNLNREQMVDVSSRENRTGAHETDRSDVRTRSPKLSQSERGNAESDSNMPGAIRVGGKDYRGEIHLVLNPRSRINVVNVLPLEQYLRGVVPMELSPSVYPEIEALKAQAIAARSYALARVGQHREEGFDLVDDTRAQVYGGLSSERALTNRAIEETRGIVVAYANEDGKLAPIEALYTANCGGRTENNEEVFGGKPVPYLRAVACSPDNQLIAERDITTRRARETLEGVDGRSIAREVALLSVLGFSLPRRLASSYLRSAPGRDELRTWMNQSARLAQKNQPGFNSGDVTRLAEFTRLVAASFYGAGRANTLLAPADVDYVLGGIRLEHFPAEARAEVAMLLRDGILRPPADAALDGQTTITRGQAFETLARALTLKSIKAQISDFRFQNPELRPGIAAPSEKGRLIVATQAPQAPKTLLSGATPSRPQESRYTTLNVTGGERRETTPKPAGSQKDDGRESKSTKLTAQDGSSPKMISQNDSSRSSQKNSLEVGEGAWLFRNIGGESYAVDRLALIGGERITYHLSTDGRVDFLEASISERGASSDRFSSVAQWQERLTVEELRQRLGRAGVNLGRPELVEPVAFSSSSRVTEVEVTGDEGHTTLRRPQIRAVLGLKEYLFVVDREIDSLGRVIAFVFTGRGWGHGVGMCQIGAYGLAKEGYSYTAILQKYYSGVKLQKKY
ncbi:MAG: SpoIID/LytB domain-containing protein [Blastocatellia bacterium]